MDLLAFLAAVIDSLAWPTTIVVLAVIFRRAIGKLLPALSRLKWKDLELEFKRELAELTIAAESVVSSQDSLKGVRPGQAALPPAVPSLEGEIDAVAEVSPRAAISLAWSAVEQVLLAAVMRLAVSPDYPPSNSAVQNLRYLREAGHITDNLAQVIDGMRHLRNRTVHGDLAKVPVAREDALEYSRLAQSVLEKLRQLRR